MLKDIIIANNVPSIRHIIMFVSDYFAEKKRAILDATEFFFEIVGYILMWFRAFCTHMVCSHAELGVQFNLMNNFQRNLSNMYSALDKDNLKYHGKFQSTNTLYNEVIFHGFCSFLVLIFQFNRFSPTSLSLGLARVQHSI